MFTLVLNKSRFYKIKSGQSADLVQNTFNTPISGEIFAGKIIPLPECAFKLYKITVGESYKSVAEKFGTDENLLKKINGNQPLYPTKKIFLPKKNSDESIF